MALLRNFDSAEGDEEKERKGKERGSSSPTFAQKKSVSARKRAVLPRYFEFNCTVRGNSNTEDGNCPNL